MHATTDEVMDENDAALSSYLHSIYIYLVRTPSTTNVASTELPS